MDENTNSFVVTERLLDGSEKQTMERVLAYRSEPLAAVYLEADATDCTIAWPVITGINLAELFDGYYEFVGDAETSIEWWVGDKFFERSLSHREEIGLAAFRGESRRHRRPCACYEPGYCGPIGQRETA